MDIYALAKRLDIPQEVIERLSPPPQEESCARHIQGLCTGEYERHAAALHALLGADEGGYKILSAMLQAALLSAEGYARHGIAEEIYYATMGCFPRFIREHKESFGVYGFDRWWWTGRQTAMLLFRIGTLEYECCIEGGKRLISVHIPSDADLGDGAVDGSLLAAREFFQKYFPAYGDAEFHCYSWLLSPALGELLPADSRINRFRRRFRILSVNEDADDCKLWVFKNQSLQLEELPEHTTLQRRMKAYLLAGGKVGDAHGILI